MLPLRKQCQATSTTGDADADLSLALRMEDDQFLSLDDIPVANNIDMDEHTVSKVRDKLYTPNPDPTYTVASLASLALHCFELLFNNIIVLIYYVNLYLRRYYSYLIVKTGTNFSDFVIIAKFCLHYNVRMLY